MSLNGAGRGIYFSELHLWAPQAAVVGSAGEPRGARMQEHSQPWSRPSLTGVYEVESSAEEIISQMKWF